MEALRVDYRPELRDPIAIVAFTGWNDAASAASNAARFLARRLGARRFAVLEAEQFYDFQSSRPTVRISPSGDRELQWPSNEFFYARNPRGESDLIIGIGAEPSLRWRTFSGALEDLFEDLGVKMVVSLGALLADVAHTRDVRVTGTAVDPAVGERLNLTVSKYEGPTGIVGVLHDSMRKKGVPAASLWANVPHYVTTDQNPPATLALLRRLQSMLDLEFDFTDLEAAGVRFVAEVDAVVSSNPEISSYVRRLEEAYDSGVDPDEDPDESGYLPAPEDAVLDVEEFLRNLRDDD
ncbi:MAG TPA: PAC2 family protein [Tepidiformaceae bacterium]|nr:PAC2 family protein [Tepidiformaceae bacterium]